MSPATSGALVNDFVTQKTLAVVGVSRNPKKFANMAYRELRARGYNVVPVNPNTDSVEGDRCYPSIKAVPETVDGVLIVVHPQETEKVVREADEAGIKHIWMQQGAESDTAIRYCKEHGLSEVHGECILMFTRPVRSYHKLHRGLWRLIGKLPK